MLITDNLARRLEMAEAVDAAGCAEAQCLIEPKCGSVVKPVAGGVAVYCGVNSPLTHGVGIGMHGAVSAEDLDDVEGFFEDRGAQVVLDVCPHAHESLRELLASRSYRVTEFINMMVCELPAPDPTTGSVHVRRAGNGDDELYVRTVIGGFFGRTNLTEEEVRLGTTLFYMPCTRGYLASVGGQTAGGGGMSVRNRVACFFGDATLPEFRGRGVHMALIAARLKAAGDEGCDIVAAGAAPGSTSQRNYHRLGFEVGYTKVTMVKV
jgi:GNAT superfamily N-acetyltransferase